MPEKEKKLSWEELTTGESTAIYTAGIAVSQALKKTRVVVIAVDALGRVKLMPPNAVRVLSPPRVDEDDLDALSENEAVAVLTRQGDSDEKIIEYLKARDVRLAGK